MAKKTLLKEKNTDNKLYPTISLDCVLDFPQDGKAGQVLMYNGTNAEWSDFTFLDFVSYGVSWKPDVADPNLTRVGNMSFHKTLPILSGMKGCIYNPKEKKVVYWLDENNWEHRADKIYLENLTHQQGTIDFFDVPNTYRDYIGKHTYVWFDECRGVITDITASNLGATDCFGIVVQWKLEDLDYIYNTIDSQDSSTFELGSNLAGYDGEVMVYVPEFWIRSWDEPDKKEVRISDTEIDNTWEHQPAIFIGAYRDTILNAVPENMGYLSTLTVNSAVSVANSDTYCRGGDNRESYDSYEDIYRRDLGKCRSAISRATFRNYTRQSGKEIISYKLYKNILYWLWVIEYATFNSQAPYNPELTAEGYHQGGMGPGVTNMDDWSLYNSIFPVIPNGYTNDIGNKTGIKDLIIPEFTDDWGSTISSQTLTPFRWRGLEDTFGHISIHLDGIVLDRINNSLYNVWVTDDPTEYSDTIENKTLLCHAYPIAGYIKYFNLGETAEIIPIATNNNPTAYKCDWISLNVDSPLKVPIVGGNTNYGSWAGLSNFNFSFSPSNNLIVISSRSVSF